MAADEGTCLTEWGVASSTSEQKPVALFYRGTRCLSISNHKCSAVFCFLLTGPVGFSSMMNIKHFKITPVGFLVRSLKAMHKRIWFHFQNPLTLQSTLLLTENLYITPATIHSSTFYLQYWVKCPISSEQVSVIEGRSSCKWIHNQ